MSLLNLFSFLLSYFIAPLPPQKQKVPLINKGPPASDDQTQIAVGFSQAALCNNSNGKINKWYIIVSKKPGVEGINRVLNYVLKMLVDGMSICLINMHTHEHKLLLFFFIYMCIYFVDNLLVYYRVNISFLVFYQFSGEQGKTTSKRLRTPTKNGRMYMKKM